MLKSKGRSKSSKSTVLINKADLEILYNKNRMTMKNLGSFYGVNTMTICNYFKRYGIKARNKAKRNQSGPNSLVWRINPSYRTIHKRIEYQRGKPKHCEECKTTDKNKKYDWANISGNYKDIFDFRRLCKDCHMKEHPKERNEYGRFL